MDDVFINVLLENEIDDVIYEIKHVGTEFEYCAPITIMLEYQKLLGKYQGLIELYDNLYGMFSREKYIDEKKKEVINKAQNYIDEWRMK